MSYKSLLFCPDEKTARVVTQVLSELEFQVEPCNETFAAVKKLMAEHFDAVVVDCENEQNAALLFKSAHNSGSNQTSLAVAVVEGQSGVAKAFRIGANLVLTKPINVEQSKGTLRVARGLLRKTEGQKAGSVPSFTEPTRPAAVPAGSKTTTSDFRAPFPTNFQPAPTQTSAPMGMASSSSVFELEKEPELRPEPTEAALLESMRDTPVQPSASKQYPWQPVSRPMAEPMTSALQQAAQAAGKPEAGGIESPLSQGYASAGQGAAAAPARAKEPTSAEEEMAPEESDTLPPPLDYALAHDSGSSKTPLIIAAIVLVAAGLGYVGWT